MAMKFKFDKAKLDLIKSFLEKDHQVKIGVLASSEKGEYDGIDAVVLAAVHEFGSEKRRIPKRSFLLKTMENYQSKFIADVAKAKPMIYSKIANGQGDVFLNEIGAKWVDWVHETFEKEGPAWPPLSKVRLAQRKRTGRAKGNTNKAKWPMLQDTGALLRSITHEVVE